LPRLEPASGGRWTNREYRRLGRTAHCRRAQWRNPQRFLAGRLGEAGATARSAPTFWDAENAECARPRRGVALQGYFSLPLHRDRSDTPKRTSAGVRLAGIRRALLPSIFRLLTDRQRREFASLVLQMAPLRRKGTPLRCSAPRHLEEAYRCARAGTGWSIPGASGAWRCVQVMLAVRSRRIATGHW